MKKKLYLAAPRAFKPTTVRYSLVYYIRLDFKNGLRLYKIGYTSMTIVKRVEGYYSKKLGRKTGGMGLPCGCTYKIIDTLYKGNKAIAYRREQELHNLYQEYRWNGPKLIRSGHTELYVNDVLGLDNSRRIPD